MLDFIAIFTKGGIVLWSQNNSEQNFTSCVNNLIRSVILEGRSSESKVYEEENLALQYKLDNELDLVFLAIHQRVIPLSYVEPFLVSLQESFRDKYEDIWKNEPEQCLALDYDFVQEFKDILAATETSSKDQRAPKQMRSYNESLKSKKTVASLIDDGSKKQQQQQTESVITKRVNLVENVKPTSTTNNEATKNDLILENRQKWLSKIGPKSPTQGKSKKSPNPDKEKAGKKPRVWDLGGNARDAVNLDRSKDVPDEINVKHIQSEVSAIKIDDFLIRK